MEQFTPTNGPAVFTCRGFHYFACCDQELDEVRAGGAFWVDPTLVDEAEAREMGAFTGQPMRAINL